MISLEKKRTFIAFEVFMTLLRNPEETDDEWRRRTEAELAEGAREKAEAPDPSNAKANVMRAMTEGPPEGTMQRLGWRRPFLAVKRWFW